MTARYFVISRRKWIWMKFPHVAYTQATIRLVSFLSWILSLGVHSLHFTSCNVGKIKWHVQRRAPYTIKAPISISDHGKWSLIFSFIPCTLYMITSFQSLHSIILQQNSLYPGLATYHQPTTCNQNPKLLKINFTASNICLNPILSSKSQTPFLQAFPILTQRPALFALS